MDQTQLLEMARQLVGYAGPLVAGGALAKLGENSTDASIGWLKGAWGLLQRRFQGNKQADAALTVFEMEATQPANQERVAQQIVALFQHDPVALEELRALVEELRRIQPTPQRSHTQNISGNARVGTAIAGDNHGNVTSIGGNVTGPVLSGTFSGPVDIGGSGDRITVGDISGSSGIAIGRGASSTVRNVNTGGGDYAEGSLDKSRRTIIGGGDPAIQAASVAGQRTRGMLPPTLSADGVHFSYGHALLIGVGEYASQMHNAPTTANDAAQLAALLQDPDRAAYPASQVTLLQNQNATRAGILAALDALAERLKGLQGQPHKPTVVVFFAGHGTSQGGSFALLPHDYSADDARGTTISALTLRAKIQAIAAHCQKLVVLLNCCYAGGTAGQVLADPAPSGAGPQLSAPPRDYVAALAPGGGRVVISSSRSEQPSAAVAEDDFSLTTFGSKLLKGLRGAAPGDGPAVGVLDLFAHLAATVPADARGIQLDQHPLLFAFEVDQNFAVALRPIGQQRGTLDVARTNDVQRLAQIEVALAALDRDEDAPDLMREREEILRRLGA
jgi:Caspase domain